MFYRKEEFKGKSKDVVFFLCPYGVTIKQLKIPISFLRRSGYTVIAFDFTEEIWSSGDPNNLREAIAAVVDSMESAIKEQDSTATFGIFGSSLGAFIGYNCMARISDISWCILNTGGDVAQAVCSIDKLRGYFEKNGYDLKTLQAAWSSLQYPNLENFKGKNVILITSEKDEIVPINGALKSFNLIIDAGPNSKVITHKRLSHSKTVIRNLARAKKLVKQVEAL